MLSGTLGLLLSTIGLDSINGAERFIFGQSWLYGGIDYIPVMIGAYAIAEVYKNISINCGDTIQESKIEKKCKI